MRKLLAVVTASGLLFCGVNSYATTTTTFYCAPIKQIVFTPQQNVWAPYLYTSPDALVNKGDVQGVQPHLTGGGFASQVVQLHSSEWTDGALACNYDGLTDQLQPVFMVMLSDPLAKESTNCQFPTNGGKGYCNSPDPYACPMVCEFGAR